jgi:2-deoxy-D-gluconate 3-dehydrogenase
MLAEAGAKVAILARRPNLIAETITKVQEKGIVRGYQIDVTDIPAIGRIVRQVRQDFGEVDILVCNAGTNIPKLAQDVTEADWDTVHDVNIKALFFSNQAVAVQSMIPHKTGAIVNIGSIMGLVGGPKRAPYCASKGAVTLLTRQEALDWAPYNIRVNAVAPAFVLTGMTRSYLSDPEFKAYVLDKVPLYHRMVTVQEVAAAVCFLASDAASMITGVILPVDGGWTAQ